MRRIVVLLVIFVWAVPALAQTSASDKEWNVLIEGAKKEGKVVVAGSPDPVMRNEIIPKFKERYGIGVEFLAGRSSEITARVKTERASGIYGVDVYLAGPDTTAAVLYADKMIDPLKQLLVMPEVVDGSKWKKGKIWFADPEERYVVRPFSSVATLLFINTDQVKPEEMRSARDLLNPKWRGKISSEDPTTTGSGANAAARFYHDLGEDFVRKLYIEQKAVRTRERRQMSDWLARGTQPICLNCREDDVRPLIKEGFKIREMFELSDIPGSINGSPWMLSLANRAPNPKAAQLFANWILSREGLGIYARGYGSVSMRTDIDESNLNPGNLPKTGVKYFDDTDWNWIVTGRHEYRQKVWQVLKTAK
ncbi:MAG TPA: extracellular solute-binding protein [Candidatus Binatia bacterium]|jgi:iron(III) transport system substrate-binding protein|nr:extracellular solute-binding protein [Candidatus Binatia bacterium]